VFKITRNGFIVCNEKYVRIKDDDGYINYFGESIKYREEDLKNAIIEKKMLDNSICIP
jgi:hypothetical protein